MTQNAYNARTADKFVVRMPDGLRKRVEQLAAKNHTSMNTEVIQAIEAHLDNQARIQLLIDALQEKLARTGAATLKPQAPASQSETDYLDGLKTGTR